MLSQLSGIPNPPLSFYTLLTFHKLTALKALFPPEAQQEELQPALSQAGRGNFTWVPGRLNTKHHPMWTSFTNHFLLGGRNSKTQSPAYTKPLQNRPEMQTMDSFAKEAVSLDEACV